MSAVAQIQEMVKNPQEWIDMRRIRQNAVSALKGLEKANKKRPRTCGCCYGYH